MDDKKSPPTGTSSDGNGNTNNPNVMNSLFDNVCPVPDNLGEAVASNESTLVPEEAKEDTTTTMMDDEKPAIEEAVPEVANEDKEDAMESVFSKFDMNCCAKNSTTQVEDSKPEALDGDATERNGDDPSLSELAARMNDIDLESSVEPEKSDYHANATKQLLPWYREPFYASLIVLCGVFIIAIIVMAVLLFKK
ncbi:hypothetical protein IV203_031876 [Nitzschia inconspicua]|uniref:Uncharacterized protein n=1 Tax=Nitzschia inconspicua TaxID=303405 RepID=A0A9K3Q302_9STRA|nr:hypothetical protein IV203_031876 [Nitzschia inconspicua]